MSQKIIEQHYDDPLAGHSSLEELERLLSFWAEQVERYGQVLLPGGERQKEDKRSRWPKSLTLPVVVRKDKMDFDPDYINEDHDDDKLFMWN